MNEFLILILLGLLILLFVWILLVYRRNARLQQAVETLTIKNQELDINDRALVSQVNDLTISLVKKESDFDHLLEQTKREQDYLKQEFQIRKKEFEEYAAKILGANSEKMQVHSNQYLQHILMPLQEKLNFFSSKVEENNRQNLALHAGLKEQIVQMQLMNGKLQSEASNLVNALKGETKTQGNWGEMILERVLEKAGLTKGREYVTQVSFQSEAGMLRPDVVVLLPNKKSVIVDAKVSLTAYERYVNCTDIDDKKQHQKEHARSLWKHVEELHQKSYASLTQEISLDFVLMFVPIEPALGVAIEYQEDMFSRAYEKNVMIVSPTTLLTTLRTIEHIWAQQNQHNNAQEIAKQAGVVYDKICGVVAALEKVGKRIDDTRAEYDIAMQRLAFGRGNALQNLQKLKELGVKSHKELPSNFDVTDNASI